MFIFQKNEKLIEQKFDIKTHYHYFYETYYAMKFLQRFKFNICCERFFKFNICCERFFKNWYCNHCTFSYFCFVFELFILIIQIQYCNRKNIFFFVQNQNNEWVDIFHLNKCNFLINIVDFNKIFFIFDKTTIIIQNDVFVNDMIFVVYEHNVRFVISTCIRLSFFKKNFDDDFTKILNFYDIVVN